MTLNDFIGFSLVAILAVLLMKTVNYADFLFQQRAEEKPKAKVLDNRIADAETYKGDNDNVNHPRHYTADKIECIDAMEQTFGTQAVINFCLCNAFKYNWRSDLKNGEEDLKKARWYMVKAKELINK